MSILKKYAQAAIAVALVAVVGTALIATPRKAEAAVVLATATGSISGDVWSNQTIATKNAGTITLTFPGGTAAADTFTITTTGLTCSAGTATGATLAFAAGTITGTVTAGGAAALGGAITDLTCAVTASEAEATTHALATNGGSAVGTWTSRRLMLGWQLGSTTFAAPVNRTTWSTGADNAAVGGAICAAAADAAGALAVGLPVTFTVSLGVVSTGTAKSTIVVMDTAGKGCTNYRGGGGVAATDTAIASNASVNLVSTLPINLTAPTGNTAAKITVGAPANSAIAPTIVGAAANYVSSQLGSDVVVTVTDAAGLGVNGQTVLVTVDKGFVVSNPAFAATTAVACAAANTKSVTASTAATNLAARGGSLTAGTLNLAVCGYSSDAPGNITVTASNITTTMANGTGVLTMAGIPAKVTATSTGNSIVATVSDTNGNKAADGTPVRFTISANAGAVSTACTTTTGGKATSVVALIASTGTVIVSTDWNDTGVAAATCAAPGNQSVATSVQVPGGTASAGGTTSAPAAAPAAAGSGTFASAPVYSSTKLAQVVFNGGTVAQLGTALASASATGVWAQDAKGNFVAWIGGAPDSVNKPFMDAFPNGFTGATALTVVGK